MPRLQAADWCVAPAGRAAGGQLQAVTRCGSRWLQATVSAAGSDQLWQQLAGQPGCGRLLLELQAESGSPFGLLAAHLGWLHSQMEPAQLPPA